jgi:hypothetical protein
MESRTAYAKLWPTNFIRQSENMPRSNNPYEELARWEKACIDELCKHGGSENDLRQLRDHFRKLREDQEAQPPEINSVPQ